MRQIFLLLALLPFIQSTRNITCTNDFTLVGNKCLRLFTTPTSRHNASKKCSEYAGNLVTIKSKEENTLINDFVGNATKTFWIGLYIFGNEQIQAAWDSGSEWGEMSDYDNFVTASKMSQNYKCVYERSIGIFAGRWIHGDCNKDLRSFVCELPTSYEDDCPLNFNGSCYLPFPSHCQPIGIDSTRGECHEGCGELVSIHSANEIRFIQNYYETEQDIDSILLGALSNSEKYLWTDKSPWDYDIPVTLLFVPYGACVELALKTRGCRVKGGLYVTPCETKHHFMCKRKAGITCGDRPTYPIINVDPPSNCNEFLLSPGVFASPNYPKTYPSDSNCTYRLATFGAHRIRLTFWNIITNGPEDSIQIYDGESEESPLVVTLSGVQKEYEFESSSNTVFVTFKNGNNSEATGFEATFKTLI